MQRHSKIGLWNIIGSITFSSFSFPMLASLRLPVILPSCLRAASRAASSSVVADKPLMVFDLDDCIFPFCSEKPQYSNMSKEHVLSTYVAACSGKWL